MSGVQTVNNQTFNHHVLVASGPVLVDFYADWCGPCQAQTPILESFAEAQAELVQVVKVNIDEAPEIAQRYGVRSIPTLALFENGEVVQTHVGTATESQLTALTDAHTRR